MPPPSEKQARLIWASLTGLAVALIVALLAAAIWGLGRVLHVLSPVIWPVAVAAVLAYLLDPVVDWLETRRVPRTRAIGLVFFVAVFLVLGVFASVVPRLVVETRQLASNAPTLVQKAKVRVTSWVEQPPGTIVHLLQRFGLGKKPGIGDTNSPPANLPTSPVGDSAAAPGSARMDSTSWIDDIDTDKIAAWVAATLKEFPGWLASQFSRLAGFFGVVAGLALIPIYLFYLLLEKQAISKRWTDYLPAHDSWLKEELTFVLGSINDYLIAFFRGQVLVAICDGALYGIGFSIIGLPYAILIGALAMVLTIIPFLGAIVTCGSALLIALITFGDWQHPLGVLIVFAIVQGIEGYVLQPKILGDRVGLHPMIIILAIMTGTTLLGGILGGLLAIPLAAALRVILLRYVWNQRQA